jgi:hypothetical protein
VARFAPLAALWSRYQCCTVRYIDASSTAAMASPLAHHAQAKYFPFLLIEFFLSITKPKDQGMKPRSKGPLSRHCITQSISPRLVANRRVGLAELAPLLCSIVIINTTFWHLFYKIWYTFSGCILEIKDLAPTKDYNPASSLILFTAIATVDK